MKNSPQSAAAAVGRQQSTTTTTTGFNGRPNGRTARINPPFGSTNAGNNNSRRQAVAKNFLLHNSLSMHGKQQQMELKKNSAKNLGEKEEGEEKMAPKENEAIGPLDVEEILWSRQIARSEIHPANMAPQRLRDMLERDLQLKRQKRPKPFLENGGAENEGQRHTNSGQNRVESDLLDWYTRDSLRITRKWADLSAEANAAQMRAQREAVAADLPRHHFEGEPPNLAAASNRNRAQSIGSSSNAASTASANSVHSFRTRDQRTPPAGSELLELCETMGEQKLDEIRETARRKARGKLLANLAMPGLLNEFGSNSGKEDSMENCWSSQSRLSLHFSKLALIPALEPLFASVALYDVRKRQKLSEHFHLDSASLSSSKSTKRALFMLPEEDDGNDGLVLVFRLEKGLARGGLELALEPYMATKRMQEERSKVDPTAEFASHRSFRQQIGLLAIPLARTVANTYFGGNELQKRTGGAPRSFTDSFIQTNVVGEEQIPNSPAHIAHQHSAPQCSDTLSESSSADRISCSAMPIRPSSSWARLSAKQSQEALNGNGPHHQKIPADFNWAQSLRTQPLSIRISHFLRSEPLSDAEMFDWLLSGQQRQMREKIPLDCRFELELCQMGELAKTGWRVISPECRLLNFAQQMDGDQGMDEQKEEWMELLEGAPCAQDLLAFPVTPRLVTPNTFDRHLCYIYPHSVNFSSRIGQNARNICIRAELFDGQMRKIPGFISENGAQSEMAQSSVQYHCKQPHFGGLEWRVLLPRNGPEGMHLRFTFLHISCKQKDGANKSTQQMETPIGFSWLPLHPIEEKNGQHSHFTPFGDQHLPISLDPLPPAICFLSPHLPFPNLHWLDSHRPLFHLSIQLVSSIQPQDPHLLAFLSNSHKFIQNAENIPSTELAQSVQNLLKIRPEPMLAFLHVLFHRLLAILANDPSEGLAQTAFDILCQLAKIGTMLLDGRTDKWGRSKILADFVREQEMPARKQNAINNLTDENGNFEGKKTIEGQIGEKNGGKLLAMSGAKQHQQDRQNNNNNGMMPAKNPSKTVHHIPLHLHEQLARLLLYSIGQSQGNNARDTACTFCWFPLALIRKTMAEHLVRTEGQLLPRKMRFSPEFIANLGQIGEFLVTECMDRLPRNFAQAQAISQAWAKFLCHAISILSRTFVLAQLKCHCQQMDQRIGSLEAMNPTLSAQLLSIKLAFIRTIYSHEHFIFLCLPFADLPPQKIGEKPTPPKPEENLKRSLTQLSRTRSVRKEIGHTPPSRGGLAQQQQSTKSQSSIQQQQQLKGRIAHESALYSNLCDEHSNRHFPIALLLSQVHSLLLNGANSASMTTAAIELLHWLISAHENDWRLRDPELRQRLALIYSPLLGIVLELSGRGEWAFWMGESTDADADSGLASEESGSNSGGMLSGRSGAGNGKEGAGGAERKLAGKKLLLCLCWLLRSLSRESLLRHLREFSAVQICQFVLLLRSLISAFAQSPPANLNRRNSTDSFVHLNLQIGPLISDEFFQMLPSPMMSLTLGNRRQSVDTMFSDKCSEKAEDKISKGQTMPATTGKPPGAVVKWRKKAEEFPSLQIERLFSRHLSTEILLLVLDQLDLLFQLAPTKPGLLADLLRLLLHILGGHNSLASFEHIFRSQRSFIRKFPDFLLDNGGNGNFGCSEQLLFTLCLQLLRHMGSEMAEMRAQAGLTTFTLLRAAQKLSKTAFIRLSKTFTFALSSYVSSAAASGLTLNDAMLGQSLEAMLQLRDGSNEAAGKKESTMVASANWRAQLEELVANLSAVLVDSLKLEAIGDDFEMAVDLMQRIARGYRNNPSLRMTWLMAIARRHLDEQKRNYAEAAQCLLHCCAIVADHLASNGAADDELLPHSVFQAFEQLSENVREEWAAQGKAGRGTAEEKGGMMEFGCRNAGGQIFSLESFGQMVEKTAKLFERAQLFELIPCIFKLVFPMHEQLHAHTKLIQLHAQIVDCLSRVEPPPQPILWKMPAQNADDEWAQQQGGNCCRDKRCFGTYFRVRFFGTAFDELDGQEFVYKEPAITKLAEISNRLEEFYAHRFGGRNVLKVIKDSNEVDPKRLDPTKAHLQITYVEAYFERWERRRRQTHVQRNYRLKQFIFATPFTLGGKPHGPLHEQHKRKTVLTVENSFPYVKTRLRVIKREQWVLSPIEVAIEDVQKRSRELGWAMDARPVDVKMLQMVLQGCIGTTVNQGPLEIARVFLAGAPLDSDGLPREGQQRRLRMAFDELAQKCADALEVNGRLMEPSREDYQRELRRNMAHFQAEMAQITAQSPPGHQQAGAAVPSPAELVQALALAGKIGPISTV